MMASDSAARLPLINTTVHGEGLAASNYARKFLGPNDPSKASKEAVVDDDEEPVKFILLAEFDIDQGATLSMQYPFTTGTNEHTLAELMLPDGAHLRSEDWTIFFLNQTSKNAVTPILEHESPGRRPSTQTVGDQYSSEDTSGRKEAHAQQWGHSKTDEMLFVLNCVKMKEDKSVRRGAMVKALAVCTSKPYIQIYKPILSLALDEYYQNPSPAILAKLFDSLNSISVTGCPKLSYAETLVLRYSDQKNLFEEKFTPPVSLAMEEREEFVVPIEDERNSYRSYGGLTPESSTRSEEGLVTSGTMRSLKGTFDRLSSGSVRRMRKSSRTSMRDSFDNTKTRNTPREGQSSFKPDGGERRQTSGPGSRHAHQPVRDTHFFETKAHYSGMTIPVRIPLVSLLEEVGDYSIKGLVQKFSSPSAAPFPAPFHPHLHTSGAATHPLMLLLNALLTQKRILFLGHGQPAGHVVNFVLATCSLTGHILRGFTERAFPYSNLAGLEMLAETPGYIAGVINPRFEDLQHTWDVLCNTETGKITVSKYLVSDSRNSEGPSRALSPATSIFSREEGATYDAPPLSGEGTGDTFLNKGESTDSQFIDEILAMVASGCSETAVRARFAEYVHRFVRLAARYEEDTTGHTTIGFASKRAYGQELGSGHEFASETNKAREFALYGPRIEAWQKSQSYQYWQEDFARIITVKTIKNIDLHYQLSRLRCAQMMPDEEAMLIYRRLNEQMQSYEQVVELLAYSSTSGDGLSTLALGLFHVSRTVRYAVVQLLDLLQAYPVGKLAVHRLNVFQMMAYKRLSDEAKSRVA
ncbi:hypothetical protein QFC21_002354 [Naganishia friedmannii]|uniref:Uncharacterized protein n=1 Tax=Naganishia friedmannii TaxID=89922 RepID=A0ACC2VYK3_9TREE|nr:hypothetical protein QFC21_002354 [Naganishia friedmannii]